MSFQNENRLDATGQRILHELQENARTSYSDLGRKVGLTSPAVAERVTRMEEAGIIQGYHASVDTQRLGYPISAFICLRTTPERYPQVFTMLEKTEEILECHHVTGEQSFFIKVVVASVGRLEELIQLLSKFGATSTAIILSSPLKRRAIKMAGG